MAGCPGGEGEGDEAAGGWSALVRQAEAVEWVTSTTLPRPAPLSRTVDYFPQDSFPPATILSYFEAAACQCCSGHVGYYGVREPAS